MNTLRTWIDLDKKALHYNVERFLRLISSKPPHPYGYGFGRFSLRETTCHSSTASRPWHSGCGGKTILMAVIKSNAYGHGLVHIAKALLTLRSFSEGGWFGVDSITEGLKLRRENIKPPVLILGYTIPSLFNNAFEKDLIISIADFSSLSELGKLKNKPKFFIKIDSGMHRRGFMPDEINRLITSLREKNLKPLGVFSHFASASDIVHKPHSQKQIKTFKNISNQFEKAGFDNLIKSMSATGGTLFYPDAHLDMTRIGMGLYGYYPSLDKGGYMTKIQLKPVLTWKTLISEIKEIPAGSSVGYNFTHKVRHRSKIAILPIGYWHGYDRRLSNKGEVLVRGRRVSVLGLVSMDMTVVDVTGVDKIKVGDEVVLIGQQGKETVWADELARKANTSHYEFLTRLNPLIRRIET